MAKKKYPKRDIYQETTDKIVERLEAGDLPPWKMPIVTAGHDGMPKNLSTGKAYRGVNIWLLVMSAWMDGHGSSHWLTFKQAKSLGGQVRKGEKGSLVTFWTQYEKEDKESEEKTVLPVLKHYTVFNLDQIDGIDNPEMEGVELLDFNPINKAETILQGYADMPTIEHEGNRAAYHPKSDKIIIAPPEHFVSGEEYYSTLFHECIHSTGNDKRLNRSELENATRGSKEYSQEELVAEMGSAYLCAVAGISPATIDNAAAYMKGWIKSLKSDKKLFITAAGKAQKAADYILGVKFDEAAKNKEGIAPPARERQAKADNLQQRYYEQQRRRSCPGCGEGLELF